eukprot:gnl/MRDRNA2_/MRDRNA2_104748_c0_seq1.p1 gnl/MRDRNA2_/MRDRNA2_104748_c0~~gnl/MRDRNA2_/MRDRNA2_104748_c0_seq1.p1  ORF type:complete len:302 (+),score=66.13 gnl/MRDRNA2_/MRDRNA2_104748_c0_seq1:96-1001(+)
MVTQTAAGRAAKASKGSDKTKEVKSNVSSMALRNMILFVVGLVLGLGILSQFGFSSSDTSGASVSTPESKPVRVLTDDSFAKFVADYPEGALVDFYTPGCAHCEKLAPDFEKAASELKAKGHPVVFADLDGAAHPEVIKKYDIGRYPTVLWFRKGESMHELGPLERTPEKIIEFVKRVSEPPQIVELETQADLNEALPTFRQTLSPKSPPIVVAYEGSEGVYAALESAADKFRGKTIFIFVKEAVAGPAFRAIGKEEKDDSELASPTTPHMARTWVELLVKKAKLAMAKEKKEAENSEKAS